MNYLCQYGMENRKGIDWNFFCNIKNEFCTYYRLCLTDDIIKMLPSYELCKARRIEMEKEKSKIENNDLEKDIKIQKNSKENEELKQKIKTQKILCPIFSNTKTTLLIDFEGYGLSIPKTHEPLSPVSLEVTYESEIGKPDFKIVSYK
jgi:hypothetical protein